MRSSGKIGGLLSMWENKGKETNQTNTSPNKPISPSITRTTSTANGTTTTGSGAATTSARSTTSNGVRASTSFTTNSTPDNFTSNRATVNTTTTTFSANSNGATRTTTNNRATINVTSAATTNTANTTNNNRATISTITPVDYRSLLKKTEPPTNVVTRTSTSPTPPVKREEPMIKPVVPIKIAPKKERMTLVNNNTLTIFDYSERVKSLKDNSTEIFKILPHKKGFDSLIQEYPNESISNVVATTGDTHSGKSTVIKALQELMGITTIFPNIADDEDENHAPTTANVNFYKTRENGQDVLFLDVEGSNGGDLLPVDEKQEIEKNFKQYGFNSISQYMEMRRNSSEEHLSRLAYTVSDVVMYVSSGEFENNITKKRAANYIVENATRNIQDILKPSLILVFNKTKFVYESVESATATFFETHDIDHSLLEYYSSVRVVFMPEMYNNRITVMTGSGEKKTKQNGEHVFQSQIKVLRQTISDALTEQRKFKIENGCLLKFRAWTILFECCINNLNKTRPFIMSSVISDALIESKDVEYNIAKKVFNNVIQYAPHSLDTFQFALLQSFKMIVAVYFRDLCETGTTEIGLENILSPKRKNEILAHLEKQANIILNAADPCTPCAKTFRIEETHGNEYKCCYSKSSHMNEHKFLNIRDYYGSNKIISFFRKISDRKLTTATVKGSFQSPNVNYEALKKEGISDLIEKIFRYYHTQKPSHSSFMVEIFKLQHSISRECTGYINELDHTQLWKCWIDIGECPICLAYREKLQPLFCAHEICSQCSEYEKQCESALDSFIVQNSRPSECIQCILNK